MMDEFSKQYVTDCEGPISLNDNAMEMAAAFIPNGANFFTKISRYDDYLADVVKKPGYKAGDTLRLIIPFFKAFGVTKWMMMAFAQNNVRLVPGAAEALYRINERMDAFIISTSYEPYIRALCETIDFPFGSTYSTAIDIDVYPLEEGDSRRLIGFKEEIDGLPDFEIGPDVKSFDDLSSDAKLTIKRLQTVFWDELPGMQAGALTTAVNPIGGREKAWALEDSLMRTGVRMKNTIYVGDSITDVQAFETVRAGSGLAVSFNGNRYAIGAADVAVYGENARILELIADEFIKGGKEGVFAWLRDLSRNIMNGINLRGAHIIDDTSKEMIIRESEEVRKKIRGVAGDLG